MMWEDVAGYAANARRLLASSEAGCVRHAALETRFAIERLFYSLLPYYEDELPDDIIRKWQPRQIIEALIECNPFVEYEQHIVIGRGQGNDGQPLFAGSQKPVSRKLLSQYYHKLGSYLHARRDGKDPDVMKMRSVISSAVERIEQHCRETTVMHNGGVFITVACECGRDIKRNLLALAGNPSARCTREECGAVYDLVAVHAPLQTEWRLRTLPFICPACAAMTPYGIHKIFDEAVLACSECKEEYILRLRLVPESHSGGAKTHE